MTLGTGLLWSALFYILSVHASQAFGLIISFSFVKILGALLRSGLKSRFGRSK